MQGANPSFFEVVVQQIVLPHEYLSFLLIGGRIKFSNKKARHTGRRS
jgi:hypothetical protein